MANTQQYSEFKYEPTKTSVLGKLRQAADLTQSDAAQFLGLRGKRSYLSVGNWEGGMSRPAVALRDNFIVYLWNQLGLSDHPDIFQEVWQDVMVDQWEWLPLSDADLEKYCSIPRMPQKESAQNKEPYSVSSTRPRTKFHWLMAGGAIVVLLFLLFVAVGVYIALQYISAPEASKLNYIIILDASSRMNTIFPKGDTKWQSAKESALNLLDGGLPREANHGLIVLGDHQLGNNEPCDDPSQMLVPLGLGQREIARQTITNMKPKGKSVNLIGSVTLARDKLSALPGDQGKSVIIITGGGDNCGDGENWEQLFEVLEFADTIKFHTRVIVLNENIDEKTKNSIENLNHLTNSKAYIVPNQDVLPNVLAEVTKAEEVQAQGFAPTAVAVQKTAIAATPPTSTPSPTPTIPTFITPHFDTSEIPTPTDTATLTALPLGAALPSPTPVSTIPPTPAESLSSTETSFSPTPQSPTPTPQPPTPTPQPPTPTPQPPTPTPQPLTPTPQPPTPTPQPPTPTPQPPTPTPQPPTPTPQPPTLTPAPDVFFINLQDDEHLSILPDCSFVLEGEAQGGMSVEVEVYTDDWYFQGTASIEKNRWQLLIVLQGKNEERTNDHKVRVKLLDDKGQTLKTREVKGVIRTEPQHCPSA